MHVEMIQEEVLEEEFDGFAEEGGGGGGAKVRRGSAAALQAG